MFNVDSQFFQPPGNLIKAVALLVIGFRANDADDPVLLK